MLNGRRVFVSVVVVCLAASGCTGGAQGGDKAGGGPKDAPVVLRMASTPSSLSDDAPAVVAFVERVAVLSQGRIHIEVSDLWGSYAADAEAQVVHAVSSGTVDIGWAGSRVFDSLGIFDFRALTAPMLIDSYALENAVVTSAIPGRMLAGLKSAGVAGLGVLGDGLRRPIGVKRPLQGAADWRGVAFGTYRSGIQEQTIRALGATPVWAIGAVRSHDLDTGQIQGFEMDIRRYAWLGLAAKARYLAANVTLWPQIDVLFANPGMLTSLTAQQRGWLKHAAHDTAARSVSLSRDTATNVEDVCAKGARFAEASHADLTALQRAMSTVYRDIARDSQTRAFVQQIEDLKRSTPSGRGLPIPAGCLVRH